MFCKNCGQKIDDDSKFCEHCGTRIRDITSDSSDTRRAATPPAKTELSPTTATPPRGHSTRYYLVITVEVIVIAALVGILVLFFTGRLDGADVEVWLDSLKSSSSQSSGAPGAFAKTDDTEELPKVVGIKGSHITDIMLGLEQSGAKIPKPDMKASKDKSAGAHYCSASAKNEELGAAFSYSLSADQDFRLISGSFEVMSDFLVDDAAFLDVAKNYLGYCATMPCDATSGSLDGIARDWVELTLDNMGSSESGVNVIWDDAKYQLDWLTSDNGQLASIWLTISRVEPEA